MLIALRILAGLTLGVLIIAGLLYYAIVVNLTEHLNQSQGGMCIYDTSGIGLGFSQKSFVP